MTISGTTSGPELLVELDRAGPEPLHRQLANGLRDAIRTGRLAPQTRLPSTRVLAADLGVSRRLVVDAYSQLVGRGLPVQPARFRHPGGDGRRGQRAASAAASRCGASTSTSLPAHPISAASPATRGCGRCGRDSAEIESDAFGYVAPQGLPKARVAVAEYLRRTRGVLADPQNIVLCSGATQAIALLAHVLRERHDPLAMEDPGFWLHRMVLRHNGFEPDRRAGRRRRPGCRRLGRQWCDGGADHPGSPVADGRGALRGPPHRAGGMGTRRAISSSRTTTTPNTVTTVRPSARCRASRPTG